MDGHGTLAGHVGQIQDVRMGGNRCHLRLLLVEGCVSVARQILVGWRHSGQVPRSPSHLVNASR